MYPAFRPHGVVTLLALLALPAPAAAHDDDDDEPGITACELCDDLNDLARDCTREFGEGHVNDVVCDALILTTMAACPQADGEEDTGDTDDTSSARDGWGDDDDDEDDEDEDEDHDEDDDHEDHDDDDDEDNRVCADQCGEVPGLIDACVAELGPGHDVCEELQELNDECAQNEPPADTGDTAADTGTEARIRAADCDVAGVGATGGLVGLLGLLGLWRRRR